MTHELRHRHLIDQLTLTEKAGLTSGANFWNTKPIERLGIEAMMLTDGPHGLRKQGGEADHLGLNKSLPATCFPPAATLANSWDVDLLHEVGELLGAEAAAEGVAVLLGPGLNIKRNPLGGRNFEYFSEDPLLSGTLAAAMIRGIQSCGVAACPKHFAVNSQETHRMSIDEVVDVRAMHEVYLEGFRRAVIEGRPRTIMTAYNKVNGIFAHEHPYLLTEVLRRQWGFDGLVVSDWGGTNDRVASLAAGGTLEMPSTNGLTDPEVVAAVQQGRLREVDLDARVDEVLEVLHRARESLPGAPPVDHDHAHRRAVHAAASSVVLLSNNGILPLTGAAEHATKETTENNAGNVGEHAAEHATTGRIAIIGDFADTPRYQGAGSSLVNPTRLTSARTELERSNLPIIGYEQGFDRLGARSPRLADRAVDLARRADVVLLFLGLDEAAETEGLDRSHMHLAKNQLRLLRRLVDLPCRIVVVLAGGAPVELPFADHVDAIVHSYLGGQGGGEAIAQVLLGQHNPSGRLAETYPLRYADVPTSPSFAAGEATAEHRDSIFVGYRYYDTTQTPVRFPFGHGLSYTTFSYSDLVASADDVQVTVTNTGGRPGAEVVQVYVAPPSPIFRARQELRGFTKVMLQPGESTRVRVSLDDHAFASFHPGAGRWVTEGGVYQVRVGASSRDIRLRTEVRVDGEGEPMPDVPQHLGHYREGRVQHVGAEEFAALLQRPLPPALWDTDRPLGYQDLLVQARHRSGAGRALVGLIELARWALMRLGRPIEANYTHFALDLPFRSIARMSGGQVDMEMLDAILTIVNGQLGRGARDLAIATSRKAPGPTSSTAR